MGKVHGSLAQAGKVRSNTPKVAKQEKKHGLLGRAKQRRNYNRRFLAVNPETKKKTGPNCQSE